MAEIKHEKFVDNGKCEVLAGVMYDGFLSTDAMVYALRDSHYHDDVMFVNLTELRQLHESMGKLLDSLDGCDVN